MTSAQCAAVYPLLSTLLSLSPFRRGKLCFKPRANARGNFAPLPLLFPKIFCKQNIFGNPIFLRGEKGQQGRRAAPIKRQQSIAKFRQGGGKNFCS